MCVFRYIKICKFRLARLKQLFKILICDAAERNEFFYRMARLRQSYPLFFCISEKFAYIIRCIKRLYAVIIHLERNNALGKTHDELLHTFIHAFQRYILVSKIVRCPIVQNALCTKQTDGGRYLQKDTDMFLYLPVTRS